MMLRWMQRTGAGRPIALMGGGTTKIGDPSFKDEARPLLDTEAIDRNIDSIRQSFANFLTFGDGPGEALMVNNAEWLNTLEYVPFLREIGRHFTINRMLTFESVKLRLDREHPMTFLEFNYMILQAYDFLELNRRYDCRLQWAGPINGAISSTASTSPPHRRQRDLRPDHAADPDRIRREDGQERRRRRLAQAAPARPIRLLAVSGATPKTPMSAVS